MNANRPLMLGIVGDSGTGKTTLVRGVVRILGHNGVTPICLDDYHRYSRAERLSRGLATSDPAANNLAQMADHLAILRGGGTIQKPVYDHRNGVLREPEVVAATGLVIAYGMLTLTPPDMAQLFDLTIYLDPDDTLRHIWRLRRDTSERGYAAEQVLAMRPVSDDAALRYVAGQRRYAGLVVRFHAPHDIHSATSEEPLAVELLLRHSPTSAHLEPFLAFIEQRTLPGVRIERAIADDDSCASDRISIDSHLEPAVYAALVEQLWPTLPGERPLPLAQIGAPASRSFRSKALTFVQILVARLLSRAGAESGLPS
jgi:phosphoribulokinase